MFISAFHLHCGCKLCEQYRKEATYKIDTDHPAVAEAFLSPKETNNRSEQLILKLVKKGCRTYQEKKTMTGVIRVLLCRFCSGPLEDSEATRGHYDGCIWPELVEEMNRIGE